MSETNVPAAPEVLEGTDLILSLDGKAIGYSTTCKVTTTAETGERLTKESSGKWKEKYVKSFAQEITAEGLVLCTPDTGMPTYDDIHLLMLAAKPVEVTYGHRDGTTREGATASQYRGLFVITSCDLEGQAGDDAKYSIKLESTGDVKVINAGLGGRASE